MLGRLCFLWSRDLENEWAAYYERFYSPEEEARFLREENLGDRIKRLQYTLIRTDPLLKAQRTFVCDTGARGDEVDDSQEEDYLEEEEDYSDGGAWDGQDC